MIRVLLVDDEPAIREGLATLLPWNELGFEIAGDAENGLEGLRKIREIQPDLAIVDIRMPEMTGLEMIARLREEKNTCRFILLTAYSDFNLAKKAIELGVDAYILKPIEEDELQASLLRMGESIRDSHMREKVLNEGMNASINRVLEHLAKYGTPGAAPQDEEWLGNTKGWPWDICQLVLVEIERVDQDIPLIRDVILEEIGRQAQESGCCHSFLLEGKPALILYNTTHESSPRFLSTLRQRILHQCGCEITLLVGQPVELPRHLPQSLESARRLNGKRFLHGHRHIIALSEISKSHEDIPACMDVETLAEQLFRAMDAGNEAMVSTRLEALRQHFEAADESEDVVRLYYAQLYGELVNRISNAIPALRQSALIRENLSPRIATAQHLSDLHAIVKHRLLTLIEVLLRDCPSSTMHRIQDYIERHYHQELRLEEIANLFNYNSTYLGKLFRQHTGMQFNAWLEKVRVEKAIVLLSEGMKVYQAAEMVGFKDLDYFYKRFRKQTGQAPSYYRPKENV